jgi:hypothetical protein
MEGDQNLTRVYPRCESAALQQNYATTFRDTVTVTVPSAGNVVMAETGHSVARKNEWACFTRIRRNLDTLTCGWMTSSSLSTRFWSRKSLTH